MPLRQLQRPLSRSLAAAVWRPSAPLHAPPLQGSSSSSGVEFFSTTRPPCSSNSNPKPPTPPTPPSPPPPPAPPPPKKSLFQELFPDEAKQRAQQQSRLASDKPTNTLPTVPRGSSAWVSQLLGPPSFVTPGEESSSFGKGDPGRRTARYAGSEPKDTRSMVVLNAASKHLSESDFLRVGSARATHVAGWVSGIVRVVPARDPHTLENLGRYYVLFESAVAARAWCEEVKRLWELARQRWVYAAGSKNGIPRLPSELAPAGSVGLKGTDAADLDSQVDRFTLVEPSGRFDLEMARYTRTEQLLEHNGSIVEKLARKVGTPWLVLVVVDGGRISAETLRTTIRADGVERNLPWRIKNLEGLGDGDGGIMPFGRSLLKTRDKKEVEESLKEQGIRAMSRDGRDEDGNAVPEDLQEKERQVGRRLKELRRYPRFIVPFLDEVEARRFVRNWHRRQLILQMGHVDVDIKEWEETMVLNVSLLW